jgi:DNA-binding response OmpR family regulator
MAKVLVVDDEHLTTEMLMAFLKILGHESAEAFSCRHAWDKLTYFVPDVVLLDIMLPDMNGLDMCRELKTRGETAKVPVIMISAVAPPMTEEASSVGADGYLIKPISIAGLKGALAKIGVNGNGAR